MKNQDKPAYPIHPGATLGFKENIYEGLTKLEYFSVMAMQAYLTNLPIDQIEVSEKQAKELLVNIPGASIAFAKELLKQLENEQD